MNEEIYNKVNTALDSIRPYLEADGGNVRLLEITDDLVARLTLEGACASCSMSAMTLRAGVEDSIRKAVPEITRIEAVTAF